MRCARRSFVALFGTLLIAGCGGGNSRLVTVRSAAGEGPVEFEVQNQTDVPINNLYLVKTSTLSAAEPEQLDSGSSSSIWGADLLNSALEVGGREKIPVSEPGTWDLRAVDRDNRYQHVAGLKLGPGGRYILELHEGSWRVQK